MKRWAVFSDDGLYRYTLGRSWTPERGHVCFIMHNPSVADAEEDDPTITQDMVFTDAWGYGGLVAVNMFAYCATAPKKLLEVGGATAIGPDNGNWIRKAMAEAKLIVVAWGNIKPKLRPCANLMIDLIRKEGHPLYCLHINKDGSPKHPLYIKGPKPELKPWPQTKGAAK